MKEDFVNYRAPILIGDYPFADVVNDEVVSILKNNPPAPISRDRSNVKAYHTEWDWQKDNIRFKNLKSFIQNEIENWWKPGTKISGHHDPLVCRNFWANVYEKGDYAQLHDHKPCQFSFAYFVQSKWYYSPLIIEGTRIAPKVGSFVVFPGFLKHRVPKHQYKTPRITLSGNFFIDWKR